MYQIVMCNTIYTWFDWFIYINILLSQIDMVFVEITTDIVVTICITRYYLASVPKTEGTELLIP